MNDFKPRMTFLRPCSSFSLKETYASGGLQDMTDNAIDVTRRTFLKHCDPENVARLEADLGYESHPKRGLTMAGDWHVSYHRSRLFGKQVYYFRHSAIEYIFS